MTTVWMDIRVVRQTYRQTDRQTDGQTYKQMHEYPDRQTGGGVGDGLACIARAMSSSALRLPWGPDPSPKMFSMILQHTQCGCQLVTHMQQVTLHLRVSDPIFQTDFSGEYIKPELHW